MEQDKKIILKKWVLISFLIFLFLFIIFARLGIQGELDLANGNSYIAENLRHYVIYALKQAVRESIFLTLTIGQLMLGLTEFIIKKCSLFTKCSFLIKCIITGVIVTILIIGIIILTMPIWFSF